MSEKFMSETKNLKQTSKQTDKQTNIPGTNYVTHVYKSNQWMKCYNLMTTHTMEQHLWCISIHWLKQKYGNLLWQLIIIVNSNRIIKSFHDSFIYFIQLNQFLRNTTAVVFCSQPPGYDSSRSLHYHVIYCLQMPLKYQYE